MGEPKPEYKADFRHFLEMSNSRYLECNRLVSLFDLFAKNYSEDRPDSWVISWLRLIEYEAALLRQKLEYKQGRLQDGEQHG